MVTCFPAQRKAIGRLPENRKTNTAFTSFTGEPSFQENKKAQKLYLGKNLAQ